MSAFDTYFTACLGSLDQSTTFFGLKAGSDSLHSYASLQIVWQSLFEFIILVVAVAAIVRVFKLRGLMDEEIAKQEAEERRNSGLGEVPDVEADKYEDKDKIEEPDEEEKDKKTEIVEIDTSRNLVDKEGKPTIEKQSSVDDGIVVQDVEVELEKKDSGLKKKIEDEKVEPIKATEEPGAVQSSANENAEAKNAENDKQEEKPASEPDKKEDAKEERNSTQQPQGKQIEGECMDGGEEDSSLGPQHRKNTLQQQVRSGIKYDSVISETE